MKILNASKNVTWTYDMLCEKYRKSPAGVSRINCNIVAFTQFLNDPKCINHLDPVCKMAILKTGHYANIEIDGKSLEIYVDKTVRPYDIIFS